MGVIARIRGDHGHGSVPVQVHVNVDGHGGGHVNVNVYVKGPNFIRVAHARMITCGGKGSRYTLLSSTFHSRSLTTTVATSTP